MRNLLQRFILVLTILSFGAGMTGQGQAPAKEVQVKAAYLYNFTKFVTWETGMPETQNKFTIGFVGAGEIADVLDAFLNSSGNNQTVEVKRLQPDSPELEKCQVLFIGPANKASLDMILKKIQGKPVLTVGDAVDFVKRGGMIRLFEDEGRIRIELDLDQAESAHLKVSSKLIEISRLVKPEVP